MTKLTTWQATIQDDDTGAAVVSPVVTVRLGGPSEALADLYDLSGDPISNPITGGADGFVQFQVRPGRYWVQAADGGTFSSAWYIDVMPEEGLNWSTRAEFVADWGAGMNLPDGAVISDGTVQYIATTGATAISDLPGLLPFGDMTPNHFGAAIDGVTDDQPAIQAMANYGASLSAPFKMRFLSGNYLCGDTIDLTGVSQPFSIIGDYEGSVLVPAEFGPTSALLDMPTSAWFIDGIKIQGNGSKNDPIGLRCAQMGRAVFGKFGVSSLGNVPIHATRVTNADWTGPINLFFNGWQPPHKEVSQGTTTLTTTAASTTITANTAIFSAGDVGRDLWILDNMAAPKMHRIASYTSSTVVDLEDAMVDSASGVKFSFVGITGAISGTTLTFPRDIGLEASDVGRDIYIEQAGDDGKTHYATIGSVTSGSVCELSGAPSAGDGTYSVSFTPAVYIGPESGATNDMTIGELLIEGHSGPQLVCNGGINVKIYGLKTHGRTPGEFSNWGRTGAAAIFDGTSRSVVENWQMEKGRPNYGGGVIRIAGDSPAVDIKYMSLTDDTPGNSYIFDFAPTDTDRSFLGVPSINHRNVLSRFLGITNGSAAALRRTNSNGKIGGENATDEASFQGPMVAGVVRPFPPIFMSNGQQFRFKPASTTGMLWIGAEDSGNYSGLFSYRVGSVVTIKIGGGPNSSVTLGTATSVNVGVDTGTGEVIIENLRGTGTRFYVQV